MHGSGATRSRPLIRWVGYVAVLVTIALTGVFWAVLTPPALSVDEPVHVNSVIRLMQGGGWPAPRTAPVLEATGVATIEAGSPWMGRTWDGMVVPDEIPAPEDRSVVGDLDEPLTHDGAILVDWMTQHPPTWYAIAAFVMTSVGAQDWRWDQLYFGIRMVSLVFVVGSAAFVMAGVRRVTGSATAAMVGTSAVFATAQYFNVLSLASNDSLAVFAGAGTLYFLIRALTSARGGWDRRWLDTVGAAVLLGLGLLTKGTMLMAIPVVLVGLLVAGWRTGESLVRRVLPACASMAIAFAVGGWYYLRNLLVYGSIQTSNSSGGRSETAFEGYDLLEFVRQVAVRVGGSFWQSTRPYLEYPASLLAVLTLFVVACIAVVAADRRTRTTILILAIYPVCVLALIVFHAWEVYWTDGRFVGLQGRYLFPAIAIYSAVVGITWKRLFAARGGVLRGVSAGVATLAFLVVGLVAIRSDFGYRWLDGTASFADGWEAMARSGMVSSTGAAAIAICALVAAGAALTAVVVSAVREKPVIDAEGEPEAVAA